MLWNSLEVPFQGNEYPQHISLTKYHCFSAAKEMLIILLFYNLTVKQSTDGEKQFNIDSFLSFLI